MVCLGLTAQKSNLQILECMDGSSNWDFNLTSVSAPWPPSPNDLAAEAHKPVLLNR